MPLGRGFLGSWEMVGILTKAGELQSYGESRDICATPTLMACYIEMERNL